ncbi:hypothetical protein ACHAXH_005405 [Discostella pseudostelligera]
MMEDESTAPDNDSTIIPAPDAVVDNIESEDVGGRDDNDAQDAAAAANGTASATDQVDVSTRKDVDNDEDTNDTTPTDGQGTNNDAPPKANETTSSESRKRSKDDVDENEEPLPTLPLKRARTAYFIFADEKRDEVKQQHPGEGVATIAKAIGQLWSSLTPTDKEVYETKAAVERERVSRDMKRLVDAGLWPENGSNADGNAAGGGENNDDDALLFPVARIRKICKLDPDVKGISKESAILITKATELFTTKLAKECVIMAQMQNRRKLLPEDVVEVCSVKEAFMFLRSDLIDLRKAQVEEMNAKEKENGKGAAKGGGGATEEEGGTETKMNTLDSYFGKVRN